MKCFTEGENEAVVYSITSMASFKKKMGKYLKTDQTIDLLTVIFQSRGRLLISENYDLGLGFILCKACALLPNRVYFICIGMNQLYCIMLVLYLSLVKEDEEDRAPDLDIDVCF